MATRESQATAEALSALIDGEATEMDLARVLKSLDDPDLREQWVRQLAIGDALRGDVPRAAAIDVSAGVRAAIEQTPTRSANPLVGLAVAASVTLAVVLGGQQMLSSQVPAPVANLPGNVVSVGGASAMQASFGGQRSAELSAPRSPERIVVTNPRVSSSASYEELAADQYQHLGLQHAAASASLQPNTLVPYARVPERRR